MTFKMIVILLIFPDLSQFSSVKEKERKKNEKKEKKYDVKLFLYCTFGKKRGDGHHKGKNANVLLSIYIYIFGFLMFCAIYLSYFRANVLHGL